tara:strand:- start:130 stop:390 length:261 start_codon:yes stop_codon:yes gene_type:complete
MNLTNKEKSWSKKYGNKIYKNIWERSVNFKHVDPYSKEGMKLSEDSAKEHGRAWWIFAGIDFRHNRKEKTWIEQFYKGRDNDASEK